MNTLQSLHFYYAMYMSLPPISCEIHEARDLVLFNFMCTWANSVYWVSIAAVTNYHKFSG